jgi:hypothetical protein
MSTKKDTDEVTSRFHVSFQKKDRPKLWKPEGSSFWRLYHEQHTPDQNVNPFNLTCLLGWLANIDMAPCTGPQALLQYLSKHCGKAEKPTTSYRDMMQTVLGKMTMADARNLDGRLWGNSCRR